MKTRGQLAYEKDIKNTPIYHDGTNRRTWHELPAYTKKSWELNPTIKPWNNKSEEI